MLIKPKFPEFKPIDIRDNDFIQEILWNYQPETSELTFTNLFIWRAHYGFQWSLYKEWLLILCNSETDGLYALPPIGPASRSEITRMFLKWLRDEKGQNEPRIERADKRLISEIDQAKDLIIEPTRDHFDYVYQSKNLIQLDGNKYHSKRNHINDFLRSYTFTYDTLNESYLRACLEFTERWCGLHRCEGDLNLLGEWEAIGEALSNFNDLNVKGCVILINNAVEAFAVGEFLNKKTMVVHIEKANPEMKGLYAVINQKFIEKTWRSVPYVNREQDLGEPGLRQAKLSYHHDHFAEKFRIQLSESKK